MGFFFYYYLNDKGLTGKKQTVTSGEEKTDMLIYQGKELH